MINDGRNIAPQHGRRFVAGGLGNRALRVGRFRPLPIGCPGNPRGLAPPLRRLFWRCLRRKSRRGGGGVRLGRSGRHGLAAAPPCFAASGCASPQCWGEVVSAMNGCSLLPGSSPASPSPSIGGGGEGACCGGGIVGFAAPTLDLYIAPRGHATTAWPEGRYSLSPSHHSSFPLLHHASHYFGNHWVP